VTLIAAVIVILLSAVIAVVVAVVLWAPHSPGDVLVYAVAGLLAAGGIGAVLVLDRRRGVTPPAVPAVAPEAPSATPPACGPPEHSGAMLAPLEERLAGEVYDRLYGGGGS
jgi:hypothetical protein